MNSAKKKWMKVVTALLLVTFLVGSATGVQRTVLSLYSKGLVGAALLAFLPIVTFGLFKGTVDLVAGALSDKAGRRRTLILGILVYLSGAVLIATAPHFYTLLVGNILVGVGEGLVFAAAMISLSDIYGTEESATSFGLMESFVYWGYGVGSFLAGMLWQFYGVNASFSYSMYAVLAALLAAIIGAKETRSLIKKEKRAKFESKVRSVWDAYKLCLRKPSLVSTYIGAHVAKFTDALAWAAFPLLFAAKHFSDLEIGALQGVITFLWALSMPFWGHMSDKIGRKALIFSGLSLKALSLILLLHAQSFAEMLLAATVVGLSYGLYYPILPAVSVDLAPLAAKGRALGLFRAIRDYGYLTGALVIGYVLDYFDMATIFYFTAALAFSAAFFVLVFVRETRPAWPFFDLILQHTELMVRILRLNEEFIRALAEGDLKKAELAAKKIKAVERGADQLKRRLMSRIWSTSIPFGDRMDFERLVETIDRVAGCILESHERLMRIKPEALTKEFVDGLLEMNRLTLETAQKFVENVKALRISPVYAVRLADEVERAESKVDRVRVKVLEELRRMIASKEVDVLTVIDMRDAVDLIEDVADDFEDASDIVRVISYKHAGYD